LGTSQQTYSYGPRLISPEINDTKKRTIKIKKRTLAKSVATSAIPPNPKNAAIMATIKKVMAQLSIKAPLIGFPFHVNLAWVI
jgi:hypothetical protein